MNECSQLLDFGYFVVIIDFTVPGTWVDSPMRGRRRTFVNEFYNTKAETRARSAMSQVELDITSFDLLNCTVLSLFIQNQL